MWSFQITYMIPIRRARASVLPALSVSLTHARNAVARCRSAFRLASSRQSKARPSLCSEVPPALQEREMPPNPPPWRLTSHRPSFSVPGFAFGEHFVWGW